MLSLFFCYYKLHCYKILILVFVLAFAFVFLKCLGVQWLDHMIDTCQIFYKALDWISLVVHQLRICLPMQRTRVQSPVQEDPTCCSTTKPVCHNHWTPVLQLLKPVCPGAHAWQQEKPPQWESCALQLVSSPHLPQLTPAQPKISK